MTQLTEHPDRVKAQFKRRRLVLWFLIALMAAMLIPVLMLDQGPPRTLMGVPPLGWVVLLAMAFAVSAIYSFRYWRCPACNKWFGQSQFMRRCPGCGVELR